MVARAAGLSVLVVTSCGVAAQEPAATADPDGYLRHSSALALYVSKGFYGQELPTYVRYLPYTHEVSIPGWRFKASLPALEIDGPGNVLVEIGSVGRESTSLVAERGVGDVVLSGTYELPALGNGLPFFDITLDLKLPTADESRGLGTGRPDVGIQLDAYQTLGALTLFGSVGYRYRHRSPVFEGLNDSASLSLGISLPLSDRWQSGVIYDFRQAASAFSGETHEVLPYLSWAPTDQWSLMCYVVKGFTEDSADRAAGIQLTRRW
ncbi:MAG: transporter [Pseudohongiella sp.]|nr:transporter [Pseudohongiella sp.]MDO9519803.1 transporter [Pseudohongiella sp.]MDP2126231.1 transporter [Pseudohongiella sp.]